MVYAVAILLVSLLTSVGLLAIWAATSRAHWFWRTMLFLAALTPLLLIPAYEPFLAFVIQGAVVAAGIQLVKWRAARKRSEPFFRTRFSLRTILLAMVPVAVLVAVSVQIYEANDFNGIGAVQIGGVAGLASLLGFWMASGRLRLGWRIIIGAALAIGFTLSLQWNEWFVDQMVMFDFESSYAQADWQKIPYWIDRAVALVWLSVVMMSVIFIAIVCQLVDTSGPGRRFKLSLGIGVGLLLLVPSMIAFGLVIKKPPIPQYQLPEPNGYDDFLAATQILPARATVRSGNFDPDIDSLDVVRMAIEEVKPGVDRVRVGLAKSIWKPLDYTTAGNIDTHDSSRKIGAGFIAIGKLAERENDYSTAASEYLTIMQFATRYARGGTIVDFLLGAPWLTMACENLFEIRNSVSAEDQLKLVKHLAGIEMQIEPLEDIVYRDKAWSAHVFGWTVHLQQGV